MRTRVFFFFFSSRRRHTRLQGDWSSDVCSSDLTTAPTMLQAGVKDNVLPSSARGVVNFRILPGDTPELVLAHVRATIRDPRVDVRRYESFLSQPSPVSEVGSPNFRLLERTIRQVAPEAIVVP